MAPMTMSSCKRWNQITHDDKPVQELKPIIHDNDVQDITHDNRPVQELEPITHDNEPVLGMKPVTHD